MRAYLSFVLVLFSLMLLFSIMQFNEYAGKRNLVEERAYLVSMNAKETALESMRQGALDGFGQYDSTHRIENCVYCPPCHPDLCDMAKCQSCFREREAMESARSSALLKLNLLRAHEFDNDFSISIGSADISAFSRAEPISANGFALDSIRINQDIVIGISSVKFAVYGSARIPGGMIIDAADN